MSYTLTIQVYKLDGSPQAGVEVNLYLRNLLGGWGRVGPQTTGTLGRRVFPDAMNIDKYLEFYYLLDYGSWHYVSPIHIPNQAYTFSHTVGEFSPPRENTALSIAAEGTARVSGYLTSAGGVGLDGQWVDLYVDGVYDEGMRTEPLKGGFYALYPSPYWSPILMGSHTFQTRFVGDIDYYACVSQVVSVTSKLFTMTVRVVDSISSSPVVGASFRIGDTIKTTNTAGKATFTIWEGYYYVRISATGYTILTFDHIFDESYAYYVWDVALVHLMMTALIDVKGICTGGYPLPSMLLEIYDKGVKIRSKTTDVASIGTFYEDSVIVTGAGIHRAQGRMVLTNPLGSYEFLTPINEFTLG